MGVLKLTDWFPGDVRPVRIGVYQRMGKRKPYFSMFNGKEWLTLETDKNSAAAMRHASNFQYLPWRGLAHPPEEK